MKKIAITGFVVALACAAVASQAQDLPQMPGPQKEHEWLQQLAGEWETESEMSMEPGKPPVKSQGTENARMLGGFWIVAENNGTVMGMPFNAVLTLGYDPEKKKYVGTWVDSFTSYLWKYEGTVDPTGKILTLETQGPCPKAPGKLSNIKEVIELKSPDQRVFTSSIQEDDGKWTKMLTVNYRRKK